MSHFSVLVVLPDNPDKNAANEALAAALQPWHEFECTGVDDKYIQNQDRTEEVMSGYDPAEDGDIVSYLDNNYGVPVVSDVAEVDLTGPHKYGWALIEDGRLIKAIRRTNPDKRWDWWVVGGRYSGRLMTKGGAAVDHAILADLDLQAMRDAAVAQRRAALEGAYSKLAGTLSRDQVSATWAALVDALGPLRALWAEQGQGQAFAHFADGLEGPLGDAFRAAQAGGVIGALTGIFGVGVPEQQRDLEAWVESAPALSCWAILDTRDGSWTEKGEMGWFGMSDDQYTQAEWEAHIAKVLSGIPFDYRLVMVDCHI